MRPFSTKAQGYEQSLVYRDYELVNYIQALNLKVHRVFESTIIEKLFNNMFIYLKNI